ncbi:MAG: DUF2490 domain-containing protein [Candidatus Omnitrophota bacterium]
MKSVILLLAALAAFSFSTSVFAGDGKYYSEFALKHKINDKFEVFFTPEMRLNDDMGNLYYYSLRGGATYHAHKNLDLSLASRFLQTKDSKGDWDTDTYYIPEMIIIPKVTVKGFNLSDANKFEYRVIENSTDRWVYRNLATIAYPTKICNFEFTPYISDEIYYDFLIEKMNLNWATVGANKKITKNLTVGLYYRNEAVRTGTTSKWVTNNILGSNVTIDF